MRQRSLDEYMSWPWAPSVEQVGENEFRLTVGYIADFAIYSDSREQLLAEWRQALRSHLTGYLAVGKVVPLPEFQVQPPVSPTSGFSAEVVFLNGDLKIVPRDAQTA